MNFTPVEGIESIKRCNTVNIEKILADILESPYDTVMINREIVSRYSNSMSCRNTFDNSIIKCKLISKLRVCMHNDNVYICKVKKNKEMSYFSPVDSVSPTMQSLLLEIENSDCDTVQINSDFVKKYASPRSLRNTLNESIKRNNLNLKAYMRNENVYVRKLKEG